MLFDQGSLSYFGSLFRRRPASLPPKCTPLLTTFFSLSFFNEDLSALCSGFLPVSRGSEFRCVISV